MLKKIASVFLVFTLFSNCLAFQIGASANGEKFKDKKYICNATIEDDFADDSVIVVVNRSNSKINKKHKLSSFSTSDFVSAVELSAVTGDAADKEYLNQEDFRQIFSLKLKKTGKKEVLKAIKELEKLDWVESAEPNYSAEFSPLVEEDNENSAQVYETSSSNLRLITANDPRIGEQTALYRIGAPWAWDYTTGDAAIKVGVIDSGIAKHPDLVDNLVEGWDFVNNNAVTDDDPTGHGTHVAGIIGAVGNNGIGISGVCWDVTLVPLQVVEENGNYGSAAIIEAMQYAANNNIPIINCSFGTSGGNAFEAAMRNYSGLIVCAAGNAEEGEPGISIDETPCYPASSALENVLSVANVDFSDILYSESNYGATSVDVAAYGTTVLSTYLNNTYAYGTGTSMAAPLVAGAAALLKSYKPDLTALEIKEVLMTTGISYDNLDGVVASDREVINIENAITAVAQGNALPKVLIGDVNGDGRDDIVSVAEHGRTDEGYVQIQFATTSNSFGTPVSTSEKYVNHNDDLWLVDVTGDGKDDLVCRAGESDWGDAGCIFVAPSTGSGFNGWIFHSSSVVSAHDNLFFEDVNGDGKQDMICRGAVNQTNAGYVNVALASGNGFVFWSSTTGKKVVSTGDQLLFGDVNGDGRTDLIARGDSNNWDSGYIRLALSTGTSFTFWSASSNAKILNNVDDRLWVGDVNGDGRSDLIAQIGINASDTGYIRMALSTGSFFTFWSWSSGGSRIGSTDEVYVGDVDGNGRTDLIVKRGTAATNAGYVYTALSTGSGFTFWSATSGGKVVDPLDRLYVADINNDSKSDIIVMDGYGSSTAGKLYTAVSGGSSFTFWTWSGGYIGV